MGGDWIGLSNGQTIAVAGERGPGPTPGKANPASTAWGQSVVWEEK